MTVHSACYELPLFGKAVHWKRYFASLIRPYLGSRVVEVGAGIGATSRMLAERFPATGDWLCLEPDPQLFASMQEESLTAGWPPFLRIQLGDLAALPPQHQFDTILYIDVLEHIEKDFEELARARERLAPQGCLIILVPAHMALYSAFDAAAGHYRRYNRQSLQAAVPPQYALDRLLYLDSVGFLASLANRLLLRRAQASQSQVLFWDRFMVPLSRHLDPLLGYRFGKSLLGIWRFEGPPEGPTGP